MDWATGKSQRNCDWAQLSYIMMSINGWVSPNPRQDQQSWKGEEDPYKDAQETVVASDTPHLGTRLSHGPIISNTVVFKENHQARHLGSSNNSAYILLKIHDDDDDHHCHHHHYHHHYHFFICSSIFMFFQFQTATWPWPLGGSPINNDPRLALYASPPLDASARSVVASPPPRRNISPRGCQRGLRARWRCVCPCIPRQHR